MVLKITKETWGKCGITTVKHYNEKVNIIEFWQKMNDVKRKTGHLNIANAALKIIQKYCRKKTKHITKKEKQKYKAFFEGETGIFIIKNLTRDIIESCKLPEAIELRKKLGYNHDDIMVREETSIAKKIIKLFPKENIVINKKVNNRKPDICLKIIISLLKLIKEIMKIMTQIMEKKEKTCLKIIILKFLNVIPIILSLIFLNFR